MGEQEQTTSQKSASTVRLALWLTFFAFLLIVIVFRTTLSEIHFGNDGVSAKMVAQDANKLSPEDRKAASDDLAQRISVLENQARTSAQTKPATQDEPANPPVSNAAYQTAQPQQASIPNLAGGWTSPIGLVYQVTQYGNYVVISETNQGVVEAAAAGPIGGWTFNLQAQTIMNSTGVLSLTVSSDQRHMTGQYRDNMTGMTMPIYLNR